MFCDLERMYNVVPDREDFRANYCEGLSKGVTQGCSDDIAQRKKLPLRLKEYFPNSKFGWGNPVRRELLTTETVRKKESDELYAQLCSGETDASATELFQGLFRDSKILTDAARPYDGFMDSKVFVASLKAILSGGTSAAGGPGSGACGCDWYMVHDDADAADDELKDYRYNYMTLYNGVLVFLQAPGFEDDVKQLLQDLNQKVFPNNHRRRHIADLNPSNANSIMAVLFGARTARARQQAPNGGSHA
ncbi:hypothetical protein FRC12_000654 [Ceratobasidium sp. 428]|nr:hypothetical protein FRC12_000654 [Ceratobasidium sp. 428]